jgi:hypothetical protein
MVHKNEKQKIGLYLFGNISSKISDDFLTWT